MTDLKISRALARALGWERVEIWTVGGEMAVWVRQRHHDSFWRKFDYRSWEVASPIAEKFDCFPFKSSFKSRSANSRLMWKSLIWSGDTYINVKEPTPQKAIAMAVIRMKNETL